MQRKDGSLFNLHIKLSDDGKTIEIVNAQLQQEQSSLRGEQSQQEQRFQQENSIISGSTGLFDLPADGGDDSEEAMFRNRMQKKKNRGLRMQS